MAKAEWVCQVYTLKWALKDISDQAFLKVLSDHIDSSLSQALTTLSLTTHTLRLTTEIIQTLK